MNDEHSAPAQDTKSRSGAMPRRASAFDVRNVIAALLGFYGIVLIIMGLVGDSAHERAKTGDVNANLWAGIVMTLVAAALALWSRLRPVIIEEHDEGRG